MSASHKRKAVHRKKDHALFAQLYCDRRHTLYLVISAMLLVAALPLLATVVNQIRMILPLGSDARTSRAVRAEASPLAQDGPTAAVRSALFAMQRGELAADGLQTCRRIDPENGLYDFLEAALAADVEAGDAEAMIPRSSLLALRRASRVNLHRARLRRLTLSRLEEYQLDPRMMETMFVLRYQWISRLPPEGPVMRDMAATFLKHAREYRKAGDDENATILEDSVARLSFDLADHEPGPEQALLAADILAAWAEYQVEANGDQSPRAAQVIEEAKLLRTRWHQAATGEEVNLLPYTYTPVWVAGTHQRVMASLAAGMVSITASLVLLIVLLTMVIASRIISSEADVCQVVEGWRKRAWLAALLVTAPTLAAIVVILGADIGWTWVISSPTLRSVWMLPFALAVWLLLVAWSLMSPPVLPRESRWRRVLWTPALLFVAVIVYDVGLRPMGSASWPAPESVLRFRALSVELGIFAIPVLVGCGALLHGAHLSAARAHAGRGEGTGRDRGKRHPEDPGALTVAVRGTLAVSVRALVIMMTMTLILLIWNRVQDGSHRREFVAAMADPVASRLGPDWRERHFGKGQKLWEELRDTR